VVYVAAGLPLARLADTRSRPFVLLLGLVLWSIMIFITGFVVAFWQLLTLRIFLGIGEVKCICKVEGHVTAMSNGKSISTLIVTPAASVLCMHIRLLHFNGPLDASDPFLVFQSSISLNGSLCMTLNYLPNSDLMM